MADARSVIELIEREDVKTVDFRFTELSAAGSSNSATHMLIEGLQPVDGNADGAFAAALDQSFFGCRDDCSGRGLL